MSQADSIIPFLLDSRHASVRLWTLVDLCGASVRSREVRRSAATIPDDPWVRTLLSGQCADGSFGVHPYRKWYGAHWRLVSLVELGVQPGFKPAMPAAETVLAWLGGKEHQRDIRRIGDRWRCHASMEGNALAVSSRLGLAKDPRVAVLASRLQLWQWPDGGWNCDPASGASHSSFHESLAALWGLGEYYHATKNPRVKPSITRATEFFLRHRLIRSERSGKIIDRRWLSPHYPPYWHYDVFQGLLVLLRTGSVNDPRAQEALDIIESARHRDGWWHSGARYWRLKRETASRPIDVVDWGRSGPSEMATLNALRVLKAAGRI